MKRPSIRRAIVPGIAALALALTVSACGAGNEDDASGDSGSDSGETADLSGELAIGGASSQEAAQNAWIVGIQYLYPDVSVTYDPVGSGGGRENFISKAFPLAGSDAYLTDDEGELSAATETCSGDPIEVPNYVSPIAIIFNVEGVDELNLSPDTLAGIFAGTITKWNDDAVVADNPNAQLPDANINPVHRSDESGTTENFTDYLDAVATSAWGGGVVETWPKGFGGEGAKGTSGVVSAVQNGTNAIGYADASQAGDLGTVNVGVGEDFVAPSAEAAAKVLEVSDRVADRGDASMAFDLNHETQEAGVYPIVLTSYLLACQTYEDAAQADLVKAYMEYILSDEGQEFGATEAGVAPLADSLQSEALEIVGNISAG